MGAVGYTTFALTGAGDPEHISGNSLTPSLLALLGLKPVAGREFRDEEEKPGGGQVAMISESMWKRRYASNPGIIGQRLTLDRMPYTVVGVVPSNLNIIASGDIFVPFLIDRSRENRLNHINTTVARLTPEISFTQAQAEMDSVAAQIGQEFPQVKEGESGWSIFLSGLFLHSSEPHCALHRLRKRGEPSAFARRGAAAGGCGTSRHRRKAG